VTLREGRLLPREHMSRLRISSNWCTHESRGSGEACVHDTYSDISQHDHACTCNRDAWVFVIARKEIGLGRKKG
jgi:hypothetical protein